MSTDPRQLHVVLFPFFAYGHMIPALDIARMFAARNVKATIITTIGNAPTFTKAIEIGHKLGNQLINLEIFKFPQVGLPEGCECAEIVMSRPGLSMQFFKAIPMFQVQLEEYLDRVRPDCLVADMLFGWATDAATKFNIPRLVFHGMSYFALCAQDIIQQYKPYNNVSSDDEPFALPLIPHDVKMLRPQIDPEILNDKDSPLWKKTELRKSEVDSFGVIVNSFYELEPDYAEFYKALGRRAWHIGPVSLCTKSTEEKVQRGKQSSINEHECLTWLDSKKANSVVYMCFGSTTRSIGPQLHEMAMALEGCGKNFIWVIKNDSDEKNEEWLPEGFEQRTKGKGLIIRGWAPQVLILEHHAVAAFVTHCGWNSTLEGISSGVPMVTWPFFSEQFYNEKLVTDILKIGVSVGIKKYNRIPSLEDVIRREDIEKAIREIMEGEKAEKMRLKAKQLKEMAWKAVEEGGSSYSDLTSLINDLRSYRN